MLAENGSRPHLARQAKLRASPTKDFPDEAT